MIYCCMTDFSTCSMSTANDFSINNDSTANSCSQSYEDYILRSCCCTFPCLSKCCYICIISGFGRKSCQFCEFFCNFFESPEKVYRTWYLSSLINRSRNTNSYTIDI